MLDVTAREAMVKKQADSYTHLLEERRDPVYQLRIVAQNARVETAGRRFGIGPAASGRCAEN
jgi:hypothetical protein